MSLLNLRLACAATFLPCLGSFVLGCGGGAAPQFDDPGSQTAQVGVELKFEIVAQDPDGDRLDYSFKSNNPEVANVAKLARTPNNSAIFRWTPLAKDLGEWSFDFTASDGDNSTTSTVKITVKSAIGAASAPLFRSPTGSGTTVDLSRNGCVDLNIAVEDQDNAEVKITQEEPVIEGATLMAVDGVSAAWNWCPTQAQADAESRYTLTLAADDSDNPKVTKDYLIVLRGRTRPDCPGGVPAIAHSARDLTTILDVDIAAAISDDQGLKQAPLLYYSTTAPGNPANLSTMTLRPMKLASGSMQNGTWKAQIPNPVFNQPAGTSATLYYVIVADDDDDPMGNCDHIAQSPTYTAKVTVGGSGDAGLCNSCSGDIQCGSDGDLCVRVGGMSDSFCLQACNGATCPSGYTCSSLPVSSVNGQTGRQCVPISGSCTEVGGTCEDDFFEENDSRTQAAAQDPLSEGLWSMASCPMAGSSNRADEDFYKLTLTQSGDLAMEIAGGSETDLDMTLLKSDGTVISKSTSRQSDEKITKCLPAGTYYARVYGFGNARNAYYVDYNVTPKTCPVCTDDLAEDDDNRSQARPGNSSNPITLPYANSQNKICPNDDDWYRVRFFNGDTIKVDVKFTQNTAFEDLDIHFYNAQGVDLTPCDADDPSECDASLGQSASSNETTQQTITTGCAAGCDYYFVVRGFTPEANAPYVINISKI